MFQVVIQAALRNLKSKLKLRPPNANAYAKPEAKDPEDKKDLTSFILKIFLAASIILLVFFTNITR